MSIYTIGDIHGRADLLQLALSSILKRSTQDDKVILLGDIIDGGDDTKECVNLILKIKQQRDVIVIKGNHEEWMLQTKEDYSSHSWIISMEGLRTIKSYSAKVENELRQELRKYGMDIINDHKPISYDKFFSILPKEHLELFSSLKDYHIENDYVFVHAGISIDEEDINKMDPKKLRWGFEGFPEHYTGKRKVIYGHYSRKAKRVNDKIIPYVRNNTICIDTSGFGILSYFITPNNKMIQIGKPI
jgi:serine/threonine protein phosphatase 1